MTHAERQSREPGHAELDDRHAGDIGAEPEEGRMPEGQHAGIAEQQVEADGEQPEDQDVDGQRLVRRSHGKTARNRIATSTRWRVTQSIRPPRACVAWGIVGEGCRSPSALIHQPGAAEQALRPEERTSAINSEHRQGRHLRELDEVMLTTMPTSRPAITAPSSEPMPPTTVTTKASTRTGTPISGLTPRIGAARTPAEPGQADAEAEHQQPDPADIDAEHPHDLRIARAGADDQPIRGLLEEEPQRDEQHGRDAIRNSR